ncbi:MAG: PAS domain-containing protein [Gammaproteobacteria bacterium]|nr:PAS domain-containing protein [Gammaproteobacteria bacterium]NNF60135.1 PAS domain-containing protein [Gammaproteobacteria bacterium]NNM21547.1 PAS domain-containing protein [Gammaproteobacteria bacterium]
MCSAPADRRDKPGELAAIVDALATAIVVLDAREQIRRMNPAAETLLGISNERATGKTFGELLPGNQEFELELRRVSNDGVASVRRELELVVGQDESRIVDCRTSPMGDGLLVELLDAEPRLAINREIALLAQQSVSRNITRQLAHEIRNPLGGLRGAAQLLQRQLASPEQQDYTRVIIEEADRLNSLADSMLGPDQPLSRKAVNIHQLTNRVCELLKGEASPTIEVTEDYDPSLPEPGLDANLVTQALLNIGRNAIQALGAGGKLMVRTRAETNYMLRGKRRALVARIDFEDDGPGVAEEIRDTLFYPLITARRGGTGLGLAVAQELIQRHDGLVQLRSAGAPTIFSVYLPVA